MKHKISPARMAQWTKPLTKCTPSLSGCGLALLPSVTKVCHFTSKNQ